MTRRLWTIGLCAATVLVTGGRGQADPPVLGMVAGIGFTMALFVAQLGFRDPQLLAAAKLGVLAASASAGVVGLVLGRLLLGTTAVPGAARTVEQESAEHEDCGRPSPHEHPRLYGLHADRKCFSRRGAPARRRP